jgi:MFS transporter, PAT family, beta-lactamase induction signal transducer AmpG
MDRDRLARRQSRGRRRRALPRRSYRLEGCLSVHGGPDAGGDRGDVICTRTTLRHAGPQPHAGFVETIWAPIHDLLKRLGPMAVAILLLVAGFRMPGYIASAMAVPLFKHQGFTNTDIATVTKVFGFWIALGGTFVAGWLIPYIGMMSSLLIGTVAGSTSHLALALLAAHGGDGGKAFWTFALAVGVEGFAYAFASIVLITYMSTLASVEHAASQFGLLTSLCAFPGSILAGFSGFVWFFIWTSLIGIPVALLAVFVWYRVGISDEVPIQIGGGH